MSFGYVAHSIQDIPEIDTLSDKVHDSLKNILILPGNIVDMIALGISCGFIMGFMQWCAVYLSDKNINTERLVLYNVFGGFIGAAGWSMMVYYSFSQATGILWYGIAIAFFQGGILVGWLKSVFTWFPLAAIFWACSLLVVGRLGSDMFINWGACGLIFGISTGCLLLWLSDA